MSAKSPNWDDANRIEARYANCFRVGANENEMLIEFAQCSSDESLARAHTRIVTHPDYARNLMEVLRKSLEDAQASDETSPHAVTEDKH